MICILRIVESDIKGWIIASDIDDARRKAEAIGAHDVAAALYRMTFTPRPGKYELPSNLIMLVS